MSAISPQSGGATPAPAVDEPDGNREALLDRFARTRRFTEELVEPLSPEDCVIQTMTETSPTKWHLAHTTWFFERFILQDYATNYQPFCKPYYFLFNSYYNTIGPQHCRPNRGLLSRPTVDEVATYRDEIDTRLRGFVEACDADTFNAIQPLIHIGIQHEQQHQELIVTDIKHTLSTNPLLPAMHDRGERDDNAANTSVKAMTWQAMDAGVYDVGCDLSQEPHAWAFDNETPKHRVFLEPYELATRPVTNGEYVQFIEAGGYEQPEIWLSMGLATVKEQGWTHPIYWYRDDDGHWMQYTLWGPRRLAMDEPVCHVSYYEADAYARWAGARLPSEFEWEAAACKHGGDVTLGHYSDSLALHPRRFEAAASATNGLFVGLFGDAWEWTSSSYGPYPGYEPLPGALGEYNGKFMCNQYVLRGGSCATPAGHLRVTYRNFFPPESRWQFAGIRLARTSR